MSPWVYILIGFVSFPIAAFFFMLWVNKKSQVEPTILRTTEELQKFVNYLYQNGKDKEVYYAKEAVSGFLIRLIKYQRKSKEDTIRVEIRATDKNADGYPVARDCLEKEGIEFEEKFTPKQGKPSRIYLKNEDGGIYSVSQVTQVVFRVMEAISKKQEFDLLVSDRDPHFWKSHVPQNT